MRIHSHVSVCFLVIYACLTVVILQCTVELQCGFILFSIFHVWQLLYYSDFLVSGQLTCSDKIDFTGRNSDLNLTETVGFVVSTNA